MPSGKEGKDAKEAAIAKAAGAAVAVGVAWGVLKFVKAKKEEDALIEEYYGDREDFIIPSGEKNDIAVKEVCIEEEIEAWKVIPPPPPPPPPPHHHHHPPLPPLPPPHTDEFMPGPKDEFEEPKPPKPAEKPWFLRLVDPPKNTQNNTKSKESECFKVTDPMPKGPICYDIKRGDTLWAISGKFGVPLDALKAANCLHGDLIYAGDKLVIPPK